MFRTWKFFFKFTVLMIFTFVVTFFIVAQGVVGGAAKWIVTEADKLESAPVVIVPGASVLYNQTPSDILADRLDMAVMLYNAQKVKKILVSGDNGQADYDEVNVMRVYLLAKGVKPEDIFLDHAGFDTHDTMYRAKNIFGVTQAIIVTQRFHLPRALYLAKAEGIVVQGVVSDKQEYAKATYFALRESFARVKAFYDVLVNSRPTYLGSSVSLEGDGQVTWDEGR